VKRRRGLFVLGVVVLLVALLPPVDDGSAKFFWVHMIQHMLMILVAAPLIAGSHVIEIRGRVLRSVLVVGVLHAVALWAWHMPVVYDAAMNSRPLHLLEHASFLVTAVLFWNAVLDRGIDRFMRAGLVFATMLQSAALGALIAFAGAPLYQWHIDHTPDGYDVLGQQQAAGAIMWIPPGVIYLSIILALVWQALAALEAAQSS
jgi:cytochrome c oxidase assembly factor CtaG